VKDEGTASGLSKEEVIESNERLRGVRIRYEENYDTAKKALNSLMAKYAESKVTRNVFQRYQVLKAMIKVRTFHDFEKELEDLEDNDTALLRPHIKVR